MTTTTLATPIQHGRRRAATSPFDEIARIGADGQPYWSARDLAKLFGYTQWRNFSEAINKARHQVESHIVAGQSRNAGGSNTGDGHFVNVQVASRQTFGDRMIPDVHLTRFAAYFVALNADQSKPEVKAAVNYYFVGRTVQAEQMIQTAAADTQVTAQAAEMLATLELTLAGLPEMVGEAVTKAMAAGGTPEDRREADTLPGPGEQIPSSWPALSAHYAKLRGLKTSGGYGSDAARRLILDGYLSREVRHKSGARVTYDYTVGERGQGLMVVGGHRGRARRSYASRKGNSIYLTPAGQEWLRDYFGL